MAQPVARNITISINGKQVENSLQGVGREIGKLKGQLRRETFGSDNFKKLETQLDATRKKYAQMNDTVKRSSNSFKQNRSSIVGGTKALFAMATGITAAVQILQIAITAVVDFTKESITLAKEAKGVEFAFKRLGDEGESAFNRIKQSTRGLLSDLDIKRSLVEFDNFNISLEDTDVLFEFLAVRATQTGQSIDKLKDSLVEGLSKESKLRIDNLGISTAALNDELSKTPNFVQAVANIARTEVAEAGGILDEAANSTARWGASTDNLKLAIGQLLSSGGTSGFFGPIVRQIDRVTEGIKVFKVGLQTLRIGFSQILEPLKSVVNQFPFLRKFLSDFLELSSTPGITIIGNFFISLGATLGGLRNVMDQVQQRFVNFFKTLSVFSELNFNPLDPVSIFESFKNFDFDTAFSDVAANFKTGGESVSKAFKEGYDGVLEEVRRENEAIAKSDALKAKTAVTAEELKKQEELRKKAAQEAQRDQEKLAEEAKREAERILESQKELAEKLDAFEADRKLQKEIEGLSEIAQRQIAEEIALDEEFTKLEEDAGKRKDLLARLEEEKEQRLLDIQNRFRAEFAKIELDRTNKAKELSEQRAQQAIQEEAAKLGAYANAAGAIKNFLGEETAAGKAAAIAQATINTYLGASQVLRDPTIQPSFLKPIIAGTIVLNGLNQVRQIASTKEPGFFFGGPTGSKSLGRDHQGDVAGVVHTNEYVVPAVMAQSPKYANVIGWLEQNRQREVLGRGYMDGGNVSVNSSTIPTETVTIDPNQEQLLSTLQQIQQIFSRPITAQINYGYEDEEARQVLQDEIAESNNNGIIAS